jgi:hypothetical protein
MTALFVLGLAACSSSDDTDADNAVSTQPGNDDSSPDETPETTGPAAEAEAGLMAYLEFRDDTLRSGQIAYERLDDFMTGAEHLRFQENVTVYIMAEYEISGEWTYEVSLEDGSTEDSSRVARFEVCEDRSGVEYVKPDGTVTDVLGPDGNPLPNPWAWTYTMENHPDHGWRVSEAELVTGPSEPHELGDFASC